MAQPFLLLAWYLPKLKVFAGDIIVIALTVRDIEHTSHETRGRNIYIGIYIYIGIIQYNT